MGVWSHLMSQAMATAHTTYTNTHLHVECGHWVGTSWTCQVNGEKLAIFQDGLTTRKHQDNIRTLLCTLWPPNTLTRVSTFYTNLRWWSVFLTWSEADGGVTATLPLSHNPYTQQSQFHRVRGVRTKKTASSDRYIPHLNFGRLKDAPAGAAGRKISRDC